MNFVIVLQAVLALIFVIGLVFLVFGLIKFCEVKGLKNPLLKKISVSAKLAVIETKRLDARNTLVVARYEDEEYLLLLGNTQNMLLSTKKVKKNV